MAEFWVSEKELADLKPLLPGALADIGFTDDGTVAAVAANCLQRHLDGESMRKALDPLLDAGAERFLTVLKERISSVKSKKKTEAEPKRLREDLPPLIEPEHKGEKRSRDPRDSRDSRDSRHRDEYRDRDSHREKDSRSDRRDRDSRHDRDDRDRSSKDRHRSDRNRGSDDRKRRRDADDKDVKKEEPASSSAAATSSVQPAASLESAAAPAPSGEVKVAAATDAPKAPVSDIKARIAEALAKAKKAKAEGSAAAAPAAASSTTPAAPSASLSDTAERIAAMRARTTAQLRKIKGTELPSMPHILRVDDQGREVDSEGRVLQPTKKAFAATTLINKKLQREKAMKLLAPPSSMTDPKKNPYFDPRLPSADARRIKSKKAFVFKEAGTYVKAAQKQRAEAAKEQQIKEAQTEGEKVPEESIAKPARAKEPIPVIEWWDVPCMREESAPVQTKVAIPGDLGARSYEAFLAEERITHYVEHPVPIEPAHELLPPPPRPLLMTKEERKKFRKKNRMEMQKEKRERQLLGLEPPPEPKVKISNLYRVLGTQAVADPSALEKMVREQMAARLQAHEQRNQERKLTPEERSEKKKKKLQEDTSKQVCACLFKVRRLVTLPKAKFKVDINAQQLYLTGCVLTCGDTTLVLAEGGPKGLKKYKTLLGRRIDWSEEPSAEKKEGEQGKEVPAAPAAKMEPNICELVWEGTLGRTTFRNFRFESFDNETAARKFLQDRGVGHLWDLGRAHVLGETPAILLD